MHRKLLKSIVSFLRMVCVHGINLLSTLYQLTVEGCFYGVILFYELYHVTVWIRSVLLENAILTYLCAFSVFVFVLDSMLTIPRQLIVHDAQLADMAIRQDLVEFKMIGGVLVWRISDISRRIQEAESGRTPSLYSPPFYTSPAGYKMCARIYLNGDGSGKNTHISLFFVVMRGDYDALLQWPFQQRVKLCLLDQTPAVPRQRRDIVEVFRPDVSSSSFQRPTTEMNVATGCPLFAPKSCLLSDRFVRDDTIFLRVEVSTSNFHGPDWSSMNHPG